MDSNYIVFGHETSTGTSYGVMGESGEVLCTGADCATAVDLAVALERNAEARALRAAQLRRFNIFYGVGE